MVNRHELANFIWQIADLLRGPYRLSQCEQVMLPFVVLRRFDRVLANTKDTVLAEYEKLKGGKVDGDALDPRPIAAKERAFGLLREHRWASIAAAVTGQIEIGEVGA